MITKAKQKIQKTKNFLKKKINKLSVSKYLTNIVQQVIRDEIIKHVNYLNK